MNLVWDKLLPAMQPNPLPADDEARKKLGNKLASLTLHQPQGSATTAIATQVSGKAYLFPTNIQNIESVKLEFKGQEPTLIVRSSGKERKVSIGDGVWKKGRTDFVAGADWRLAEAIDQPIAASGAWTADDTYTAKISYYETPMAITFTFRFAGNKLLLLNVGYSVEQIGDMKSSQIIGEAQ
jgi:hypothetical protein